MGFDNFCTWGIGESEQEKYDWRVRIFLTKGGITVTRTDKVWDTEHWNEGLGQGRVAGTGCWESGGGNPQELCQKKCLGEVDDEAGLKSLRKEG